MKRFFIFTALYPPIALAIFSASDSTRNISDIGWMLVTAYGVGLLPAWASGTVDAVLRAKPIYLRMPASAVTGAAALMNVILALYFGSILSSGTGFLTVSLIGGIPAAVCSWLSGRTA